MYPVLYSIYTAHPELLLREVGEETEVLAPHLREVLEKSEEKEKKRL